VWKKIVDLIVGILFGIVICAVGALVLSVLSPRPTHLLHRDFIIALFLVLLVLLFFVKKFWRRDRFSSIGVLIPTVLVIFLLLERIIYPPSPGGLFYRSTEAINAIHAVREALEKCAKENINDYSKCNFDSLDIRNPAESPGSHFSYTISNLSKTGYVITAIRNTRHSSDKRETGSKVFLKVDVNGSTRGGTGIFEDFE